VKWVKMGAPDPRDGPATGRKEITIAEGRKFWSFQPVRKTAAPPVKDWDWARTEIDQFVLARLESRGLQPVAAADRRTLLRRVCFESFGLPLRREECDAFWDAKSPTPFARVVARLLACPHFGERWGRHWLDLARYAETNGFERIVNVIWHNAWRYREYVL